MLNIVDKPAIQYIVEEAVAAGIEDILIVTNRGKGAIEDHFDHSFELEAQLAGNPSKSKLYEDVKPAQTLRISASSARRKQRVLPTQFSAVNPSSEMSLSLYSTAMTLSFQRIPLPHSSAVATKNTARALSA